ncbi:hypothetical protein AB0E10_21805 [Streptomyces sp. NPDC048045]|uniref:hypothetical protein n=1 Tax=Streptomyces sp. NPDC048045 TaxID=3154710 RepID=UPI00342FF0E3
MTGASRSKKAEPMVARAVAATAVFAAFGVLAGCSEPSAKKEYDVPRALCGVSVDPDLVSPFLPAGKKVAVVETRPVPSRKLCRVDVDGKWAMMANLQWWADDVSLDTVAYANPQLGKAGQSADDHFLYSGTGAVKLVDGCKNAGHSGHLLYASVRVRASDLGDAPAMKKLATTYTEAVGHSGQCS